MTQYWIKAYELKDKIKYIHKDGKIGEAELIDGHPFVRHWSVNVYDYDGIKIYYNSAKTKKEARKLLIDALKKHK